LKGFSFNCPLYIDGRLNEVYFKICSQGSSKEIMSEEITAVQHGDSINISEAERELIPSEGYIVDYITGEKLVKDTPKEQVRQFIAKALEQELIISSPPLQVSQEL
jgi:hypothetical protein